MRAQGRMAQCPGMADIRDGRDIDMPPGDPAGDRPSGDLERLGEEDGPVGLRTGRNPANLGDEIPDSTDITYPPPVHESGDI
jgi:hypothetical protein